jgi:hypothetical protein
MTGKRVSIVALAALAVASMLLGSLAGCECQASYSSAYLSEATMCKSVDAHQRPIDKTDIFSANDPKIYCSVKLSNAPDDTEVKAVWVIVQGEFQGQSLTNYTADEASVKAGGTKYASFYLSQTKGFPTGDWAVKLFLNGKEELTVPFKVQ